jgi:hypothetical protein
MYLQQLFMLGDPQTVENVMLGKQSRFVSFSSRGELPEYAEVEPSFGQMGVANHALINGRIMVQGLSMFPGWAFEHSDPVVREVNSAYLSTLWQSKRWDQDLYVAALEIEANGMAQVSLGVDDDGVPELEFAPNLDCIVDCVGKLPNRWRHVTRRYRRSVEDICEMYPVLDEDEVESWLRSSSSDRNIGSDQSPRKYVCEWVYYDKEHHVVFLDTIQHSPVVLKLDSNGKYIRCVGEDPTPGPNPFGMIPHSWWIDSWAPMVRKPVGKIENSMKPSALLNEVELCMVEIMRNGIPITGLDVSKVGDPEIMKEIKDARTWKDIRKVFPMIGDVRDVISRVPAVEMPGIYLQLRSVLKDEINAATGVSDMQRGAALGGERRTRYEVSALVDQSGIQARHFRRQFAMMLEDVGQKARALGLMFDTKRRMLTTESFGTIDTGLFPLELFLSEPARLQVMETTLQFKTSEQHKEDAMTALQGFYLPMIQMGAADPVKVMRHLGSAMGHRDISSEIGIEPVGNMMQSQEGLPIDPSQVQGISPIPKSASAEG